MFYVDYNFFESFIVDIYGLIEAWIPTLIGFYFLSLAIYVLYQILSSSSKLTKF